MDVIEFPCMIGRHPDATVELTGIWVGKDHTEIRLGRAGFMVHDQGTLAGTQVNGQRVSEYGPLKRGDQIQIGSWTLSVESVGAAVGDVENTQDFDQDLVRQAIQRLRDMMDLRRKDWQGVSDAVIRHECEELLDPVLPEFLPNNPAAQMSLRSRVISETVGLGPLEEILADDSISEIMINQFDKIFVEKNGKCVKTRYRFANEESVRAVIERIVSPLGRRIDDASPMVDARLADGSRVNAIIRPLSINGPCITIRRFGKSRLSQADFVRLGSATHAMLRLLQIAVENRFNMIVSGGTGSGKTTLLNMLSQWIPAHERLITIEDAAELQLDHENLVPLEVRSANAEGQGLVSIRDLLKNSLRMRPDRIIVGECRGGETLDMLQAMNTGHEGSLTTVHANNPRDALGRVEVMVLMAGFELPLTAIRDQIASAIDLIIHQQRCADGKRRIVSITEVTGVESGVIQTQEIFFWDPRNSQFSYTGIVPNFIQSLKTRGVSIEIPELFTHDEAEL